MIKEFVLIMVIVGDRPSYPITSVVAEFDNKDACVAALRKISEDTKYAGDIISAQCHEKYMNSSTKG